MGLWYEPHDLLSHNALFNFIVGQRGGGKTYGFKKLAIKRFLKHKRKFIYLRRYKTEFNEFDEFFKDVARDPDFADIEFEVKGKKIYINDELAGYGIALSTALTKKSVDFQDCYTIIFDEFVIDSKVIHYLSNEVTQFLEFFETVNRLRLDPSTEVQAFFLSNAVSVVNPYFLFWNLRPNSKKRFTKIKGGNMLIEFVRNEEFIEAKYNTRFGQIIKGTNYGNYAVENQYLKDNNNFVEKKTGDSKFVFSIVYNSYTYGFFIDYKRGLVFASYDYDPSNKLQFVLSHQEHGLNLMLVKTAGSNALLKQIIQAYNEGYMRFEDLQIKNQFIEIIGTLRS